MSIRSRPKAVFGVAMTFNFYMTIWHIIVRMHEAYFTILLFDFGGKELYF